MFACLARVSGEVSAATSRSTSRPTSRDGEAASASTQAAARATAGGRAERQAEGHAEASAEGAGEALAQLAADFSPRFEQLHDAVMLIDVSGLGRVIGPPTEVARELARAAKARGLRLAIAIAATRTAATLLALHAATRSVAAAPAATAGSEAVARRSRATASAQTASAQIGATRSATAHAASIDARADIIVVPAGEEEQALAVLPVSLLAHVPGERMAGQPASSSAASGAVAGAASKAASDAGAGAGRGRGRGRGGSRMGDQANAAYGRTRGKRTRGSGRNYRLAPAPGEAQAEAIALLDTLRRWGIQTLGELLRLPGASLFERFGPASFWLRQVARGIDARPLVPSIAEEAFEATLALEWPLDNLEPLAFVLGQIVDPLCARLEQRDRGAVIVHVALRLVTKIVETRRIELPAPMRDAKVLRTLVLLDLESHPPGAGIDSVTIRFDVTPGRIVQHSLLTRALPSPEQLSTLLARLTAVMGEGRVGAPALIDSHRPEAFALRRFNPPVMADSSAGSASNGANNGANGSVNRRGNGGASGARHHSSHDATGSVAGGATGDAIGRVTGGWRDASVTSLRRFRRPLPIDVRLQDGRPVHLAAVRGVRGGRIVQAAGPWRSSGQWWQPPAGALAAIVSTMTGMSTEAPRPLSASTPAPPVEPTDAPITASQSARKVLSKPLPGSAEAGAIERQRRKGGARGAMEVRGAKTGAVVPGASAAGAASGVGAGAAPDGAVAADVKANANANANANAEREAAAESEASAGTGAQPGAFTRAWVRDEWDIVLSGGELCRIYYDGVRHQWMLASIID